MIFLLYRLLCRNKTLGKINFESVCFRGSELNPTPEAIIIYLLYFFNDFYAEMKILRNSEVCSGSRLFSRSNIRIRTQISSGVESRSNSHLGLSMDPDSVTLLKRFIRKFSLFSPLSPMPHHSQNIIN